jgi:hypothetical protein
MVNSYINSLGGREVKVPSLVRILGDIEDIGELKNLFRKEGK